MVKRDKTSKEETMDTGEFYLVLDESHAMESGSCSTLEDAKSRAAIMLTKNQDVKTVEILKLVAIGYRKTTVEWKS